MTQRNHDRALIRDLAARVAEAAREPRMAAILTRWRDANAGRKPDRAPVWCRPVGCWREILPPESLACEDAELRAFEYALRQILHKRELADDTPIEAAWDVPAVFRREPANTWGVDIRHEPSAAPGGAWRYDPPLKEAADFDRLRLPVFTYDAQATARRLEEAAGLFDGILDARLVVSPPLGATLGTAAADLRGLDQMMLDMALEPELLHRLMAFLRDATLAALDQAEATGLLSANNTGPMLCSDPIGQPGPGGRLSARNLWVMANSQEFDQVSPDMWEAFCLDYQKPILSRFGRVCYGCCENLTHKLEPLLKLPNLGIITCSAWTNFGALVERVGRRHTIMWRQKASDVVFPDDVAVIRKSLQDGAGRLKGCSYQIVLRELETLAGHPDRLHVWTRLAIEAAEQHA